MNRITATEAARNFSDVLNRAAAGEATEVVRNGLPVAVIAPARSAVLPANRFGELLRSAPPVDREFAADLEGIRAEVSLPENPWPS